MKNDDNEPEMDYNEELIVLKRQKSKAKSAFTRTKNQLLQLLDEDLPSIQDVNEFRTKLNTVQENVMDSLDKLSDIYIKTKDLKSANKIQNEMEQLNDEYAEVQQQSQEYIDEQKSETGSERSGSSSVKSKQREEWRARQHMEGLRREIQEREELMLKRKKEIKESYQVAVDEIDKQIENERQRLCDAELEVTIKHREVENEIDRELSDCLPECETLHGNCEEIRNTQESINMNQQSSSAVQTESTPSSLGSDLWKQLKRVSIPIFTGDKRNYQSWKAALIACIDKAPATKEYKLLQLRQYLGGEALKVIENLGHSGVAYDAAKDRLDRKYGGQRRQIAMYIEELESFQQIRDGSSKDIDKFADLLDIAVVNLKEAGRTDELKNGSLYNKLQRKMTASMLSRYHRWIFENKETESVESLRVWILQEAEFQTIASETIHGISAQGSNINTRRNFRSNGRDSHRTFFGESGKVERAYQQSCKYCNKHHGIRACDEFRKLNVNKRWDSAKRLQLCYRCLGHNHVGKQCTRSRVCNLSGCKEIHHRLLHLEKNSGKQTQSEPNFATKTSKFDSGTVKSNDKPEISTVPVEKKINDCTMVGREGKGNFVTLRTVPVILKNGNKSEKVNALLDDASTKTYINADVAAELGLQGQIQKVTVNVLNDNVESFETMPVDVELQSLNGKTNTKITAFTTNRVTGDMQPINWNNHARKWQHLTEIQFPNLGERPTVDLLIGLDYSDLHYSYRDVRGKSGEPMARLTPLGWTCIGNPNDGQGKTLFNRTYFVKCQEKTHDIDNIVKRFWEIENVKSPDESPIMNNEEQEALGKVEQSFKFSDGHYEIGIPWKNDAPKLPNNYNMAVRRLDNTEKRLLRNPEIAKAYTETIEKYVEKGYVRKVQNEENTNIGKWFLPHFAVVRPDKETTKTRIVFDASATYDGISLNDVIHQGPKLQRELFDVLLRFRKNPIALVCDIAEMYLRIGIPPEDRPFHRFLWRSLNTNEQPEQYEFNSVVFGVNSSPFQAQFVSQKHAELFKNEYPLAAETVLKSTYMDDSMDSVLNEKQGIELYYQLSKLWGLAGMHARKWISNSKVVLQHIPEEDRASHVDLDKGHLPSVKTLGVLWQADSDMFTFTANPPTSDFKFTKRNFLSKVAMLFDPLGFIAPYTVRAKILLQEIWSSGVDWDDPLDNELIKKCNDWFCELTELCNIKVPRCLQLSELIVSTSLHTFCDASQEAYGSIVYARHVYQSGIVSVRCIAAKSRDAPLTSVSIPRLELMAAVLGLRLALSVGLALEMETGQITFWSDNMNVLYWIRGKSREFKTFVANRIGEIHRSTNPKQWRYVPTNENPADLLSRGRTVVQLQSDVIWWNGPAFLANEESYWPETNIERQTSFDKEYKSKNLNENASTFVTLKSIDVSDLEWATRSQAIF